MANDKSKPRFEAMPEKAPAAPAAAPEASAPAQVDLPIQQSAAPLPLQTKAPVAEPAPAPTCDRFKVVESSVFAIGGQITTIQAGAVVSDATHGPGAVSRMREQKIKLEKV
jgi:hypothetical protein